MIYIYCKEPEVAVGHIEIAFMGYDAYLTRCFFREFIEDNESEIEKTVMRKHGDCVAYFKDGTVIRTFESLSHNRRGYKIDQIILADDSRKEIYSKRVEDIRFVCDYFMNITCVPEEFQIIYMNVDDPREEQVNG